MWGWRPFPDSDRDELSADRLGFVVMVNQVIYKYMMEQMSCVYHGQTNLSTNHASVGGYGRAMIEVGRSGEGEEVEGGRSQHTGYLTYQGRPQSPETSHTPG
jgi:hypothetical protein